MFTNSFTLVQHKLITQTIKFVKISNHFVFTCALYEKVRKITNQRFMYSEYMSTKEHVSIIGHFIVVL